MDLKTTKTTTRSWRFIPRLKILQKTLLCSTKMNHTVSREFLLRRESKKWSCKFEKVNVTESRNLILQMRILSGDVYAWNFEIMFKMDVKATIHMRFWLSQKSSPACFLKTAGQATTKSVVMLSFTGLTGAKKKKQIFLEDVWNSSCLNRQKFRLTFQQEVQIYFYFINNGVTVIFHINFALCRQNEANNS